MQLGYAETGLLEDCYEDWRALWEIPSVRPVRSIDDSIAFVTPLVMGGYLTTLKVTAWEQAKGAVLMPLDEALAVVKDRANYSPPAKTDETFYLLAITAIGEAAIPPAAFAVEGKILLSGGGRGRQSEDSQLPHMNTKPFRSDFHAISNARAISRYRRS
ncbi:hypothetical protein ASE00_16335 [Sphingomonas sp. Root710]|uniref:hypothetical protein n=1 Tax=Sphingomonas sp. Root710 TaxID=1736594 RepID=UPI0006F4EFE3|nr:hypothetical protein [Sphingomonas sp. Root710]KRB80614.1 hypothetical protein ASE00_16335 [Sphingomonas sp. Root710]